MNKSKKFSPEVRERAVRMVQEHRGEYPSLWAAVESIASKIGCVPQALNEWDKRDQVDTGVRDGITTSEREGNPPERPKVREVEFSKKEVLREEVKIYGQPNHGCVEAC